MSTRDTILEQLKEDLEDKLHSSYSDNYTSDIAEVRRGIHSHEEAVNRPFIGFALEEDEMDEEIFADTGNNSVRRLLITLYGFVEVSLEDYDELHALVRDLEYFFKYDFTYNTKTVVGNVRTIEGGVRYPVSYLDMEIRILYINEI